MTTKLIKVTDTTLRDAHQSLFATRFNNSTISKLAPLLDKIGYDVLEVWGGATFDSCIRYLNEDPWDRLKMIKRLAPNTNLSMLIRGANLVGYRHYSEEIINEFVSVSADFGIDIFRLFDALNDPGNLETASKAIKNKNKHLQLTICYSTGESGKLETKSTEIYTLNYYINLAKKFVTMGADSLCIKDMAGLLSPYDAYTLITELKNNISIPIQLHNHYTSGLASMTQLKAIEAGVDGVDTCISTVAQKTSQPAIEPLLKTFISNNSTYKTNIDFNQITKIEKILEEEVKKYTSYSINTKFSNIDSGVLIHQIPGGMISNLTSQLNENNNLNKLPQVLDEIPKVRKDLGMPPLVTPISQMVGAQAVSNVMTKSYENISDQVISYLSGNYGKPPGKINKVKFKNLIKTVSKNNENMKSLKIYSDEIKDISLYHPDVLTYALFDDTGKNFLLNKSNIYEKPEIETSKSISNNPDREKQDNQVTIQFENKEYTISINVVNKELIANIIKQSEIKNQNINKEKKPENTATPQIKQNNTLNKYKFINSPMAGTVIKYLVKTNDKIKTNQEVAIIESMKMETTLKSDVDGTILEILIAPGGVIQAQEPIIKIN